MLLMLIMMIMVIMMIMKIMMIINMKMAKTINYLYMLGDSAIRIGQAAGTHQDLPPVVL